MTPEEIKIRIVSAFAYTSTVALLSSFIFKKMTRGSLAFVALNSTLFSIPIIAPIFDKKYFSKTWSKRS
jgi:hypothetical protein